MTKSVRSRPWRTPRNRHTLAKSEQSEPNFYNSPDWKEYSKRYRRRNKWCVMALELGKKIIAEIVDHIIPMRYGGSPWDPRNHQGLSWSNHSKKTRKEDHGPMYRWVLNEKGEKIPYRDTRGRLVKKVLSFDKKSAAVYLALESVVQLCEIITPPTL